MKGKLKCVVALILCMSLMFGTSLSTLADTETTGQPAAQTEETKTAEGAKEDATKETSGQEADPQQGQQQAGQEQAGQPEEQEKEETIPVQEHDAQGENAGTNQAGENTTKVDKNTKTETTSSQDQATKTSNAKNVIKEQTEEKTTENDAKEETPDINKMSAKEAYTYLLSLENDAEYYQVWESLSDAKEKELMDYINTATAGEEVQYSPGTSAVNFALAAPLAASKELDAKTVRNIILNSDEKSFQTSGKKEDDGVHLSKKLVVNGDDDPYLQLESFVTGSVSSVDKRVPVDIVLVLDQSGSMAYDFEGAVYRRQDYTNSEAERNQENLYVYVDGKYRKVTVERQKESEKEVYTKVQNKPRYSSLREGKTEYFFEANGNYYPIYVKKEEKKDYWIGGSYTYYECSSYYVDSNNNSHEIENGRDEDDRLCDYRTIYKKETVTEYSYIYSYIDDNNESITIETSVGANTHPNVTLYRSERSGRRLDALQNAVTGFVNSVETDAQENNVNHRIALVGFSSNVDTYYNTEILTGCDIKQGEKKSNSNTSYFPTGYEQNGVYYKNNYSYTSHLPSALQDITQSDGRLSVQNAIDALTAWGGTQTDHGLEMAEDILDSQQQYQEEYRDGTRKKVVIVFTDGEPTGNDNKWNSKTAQSAITAAKALKDDNTTIYSIGIFDNANGSINDSTGEPNSPSRWSATNSDPNKFMHLISSNYPSATSMNIQKDTIAELGKDDEGHYKSYYLSAKNADDLSNVFQSISDEIGGATVDLDESTVLYDAISDSFALPANVNKNDIKVFTSDCIGVTGSGDQITYRFDSQLKPLSDVEIEIDRENNSVKVWGFDYGENYVGKNNDQVVGKKLVVRIPIDLSTKHTFGGNGIPTNDSTSGLYDATGSNCYGNLEIPTVNIPIQYQIATQDQTIYRTNAADLSEILKFVSDYTPNGTNNKYVNITYTLTAKDSDEVLGTYTIQAGNSTGTWNWTQGQEKPILDECKEYELSCKVTPTSTAPDGSVDYHKEATEKTFGPETAWVHVLIPQIKVEDKKVFLGDSIDISSAISDVTTENWIDQKKTHKPGTVKGTMPAVTVTPELVEGTEIDNNNTQNYKPEQDSNFRVNIKIGSVTELEEGKDYQVQTTELNDDGCWKPIQAPKDHDFTIHVVAGEIHIKKLLKNAEDRNPDLEGDPIFTFRIAGANGKTWYRSVRLGEDAMSASTEVLSGLPKGVYTITELDTIRYENTDVGVADGNKCLVSTSNLSITVYIGQDTNSDATVIEYRDARVQFTNTRNDSSKLTDSDIRLNRFTKSGDTWECKDSTIPQTPTGTAVAE